MSPFRRSLIDSHIEKLKFTVKDPVRHGELRSLFAQSRFTDMAKLVRDSLNLNMRLRVGLVNSGGPDAPAWIQRPVPMPSFGTHAFRETVVTMFLRKSFLVGHAFEAIVCAMAHEQAHIVLFCTNHSLQDSEEAVDLTAMMLGYRDFYRLSSRTEITGDYIREKNYGYLSPEEVTYAANIMSTM